MPLKIALKPKEKLYISGAVLVNGDSYAELSVLNPVSILREKEIMKETEATTPCSRVYLAVQMMYLDEENITTYQKLYWSLIKDLVEAAPSTEPVLEQISELILSENYYKALKTSKKLIAYEKELLEHAE